jgi:hypothetical protein
MKLYDYAQVIRSKNAGPFMVTIDIILDSQKKFEKVLHQLKHSRNAIAALYSVSVNDVQINCLLQVFAIKISIPRAFGSSGGPGDRDVYGCQQHFPLADIDIDNV